MIKTSSTCEGGNTNADKKNACRIYIVYDDISCCKCFCFLLVATQSQIVTDLVSPAYEYAAKTENYLTITSSTADCKSLCNGMAGVTQITVEHTLEKHWGLWIWNEVDGASWTKTVDTRAISFGQHQIRT